MAWQEAVSKARDRQRAAPPLSLPVEDFMGLAFPKREMLLAPWLPNPGSAMLVAPRGGAKTFLGMSIAFAVARGESLLGWECQRPGRVLYVDGELPGSFMQDRLRMYGTPPKGTVHVVSHEAFLLRREVMPDLGTEDGREVLDRIIDRIKPDLVILDSLSTLVRSGEENTAESWAPVQAWIMRHRFEGRTMLLLHHTGKSGKQRGTSKREDTCESVLELTKIRRQDRDDIAENESMFQLEFSKGRELFGLAEEPLTLRLSITDGRVAWSYTTVKSEVEEKVEKRLSEGAKQKDIAAELKLSKGRISQIVKKLEDANDSTVIPFPRRPRNE